MKTGIRKWKDFCHRDFREGASAGDREVSCAAWLRTYRMVGARLERTVNRLLSKAGATPTNESTTFRLTGQALERLAAPPDIV